MRGPAPRLQLAGGATALLLALTSCGKKEVDTADEDGAKSREAALLESVQKTVDEINERTRKVAEAAEGTGQ